MAMCKSAEEQHDQALTVVDPKTGIEFKINSFAGPGDINIVHIDCAWVLEIPRRAGLPLGDLEDKEALDLDRSKARHALNMEKMRTEDPRLASLSAHVIEHRKKK